MSKDNNMFFYDLSSTSLMEVIKEEMQNPVQSEEDEVTTSLGKRKISKLAPINLIITIFFWF